MRTSAEGVLMRVSPMSRVAVVVLFAGVLSACSSKASVTAPDDSAVAKTGSTSSSPRGSSSAVVLGSSTAPSSSSGSSPTSPPVDPHAGELADADVKALSLSPEGEKAVRALAKESTFGGWAVGAAGSPSEGVRALRAIWKEKNAPKALSLVLAKGTLAGQLMALAGLYDADPEAFAAALPRYRGIGGNVSLMTSGCMGPEEAKAASVVERADAVRLQGPEDDLAKWSARNPKKPIELDITGGGYTSVMRPR